MLLQLAMGGVGSGGHVVEEGEGIGSKLPGGVPDGINTKWMLWLSHAAMCMHSEAWDSQNIIQKTHKGAVAGNNSIH